MTSGAVDPFADVIPRARRAGSWVHVDGAFGLWAAASPARRQLVAGVEDADSWVTDAHKWLNTPYDCGMAIVRDPQALHRVMATQAPYLTPGATVAPKDMGPEFSRSARAVEVWAALYSLGRRGVAELIERTCAHARAFADGLTDLGYTVLNDVVLNQVVAVPPGDPDAAARIAARVQGTGECWFGPTVWRGRHAIRISVSSHATTDDDVRRSLAAIAAATEAELPRQPTAFYSRRTLGRVLAAMCNLLNPTAIILGGELGTAGPAMTGGVEASIRRYVAPAVSAAARVVPATLGARAELTGALAMAAELASRSSL